MQGEPTSYRVGDPGIRDLLSEASRLQAWLDVEVALAQSQAELDIIPQYAADEITRKAKFENLDLDNIHAALARTGHPIVPLVWELDRICDGDSGGYIHWGATTQNITQTGRLLVMKRAHAIFLGQLADLLIELADLAERTKDMALPGRTHGQHAVPATFGYKVAVWIDELCRHIDRLRGCEGRVFVTMLGGGAGTLASLGEIGLEIQDRMAVKLGMASMPMPSRTIGDHMAEYVCLLGMLAATSSKIGREVYTLMKDEFGEVEEPVPEGTVGSSTMPQKRNPKLAQDIVAGAAQVRALVPLALEAMQTEHEADRTTSVMMDKAINESCALTGDILQRLVNLFGGLRVFPERMRKNLDLSGGLIMAEAVMLELGREIGRQSAHDAVYDAAQASFLENRPFTDTLAEVGEVSSRLSPERITELLDPTRYTGVCSVFAERGAKQAREVAGSLK
ncbi:MAG: adenylosuccinate lyase family protein [Chloroflexi bacterium]|nr:adenylosuccinate lyase family protein [Chloroflexota bacterium]MDA1226721.1 adenylosuccinate lyase family protein [Chloroflexota bacterium]